MAGHWPRSFLACLWTSTLSRSINTQKNNPANISHLDRASLIHNPYLKGQNALAIFADDQRIQSPCVSLACYNYDLLALGLRFHVKLLKSDVQSCALWNRNHIETVQVFLIVVWITRTFQSVVYNLATSY